MGHRGKPQKRKSSGGLGKLGGLASGALGMGKKGGPSGMSSGLYRVTPRGEIIKVSQKKRKKGYRMPRMVSELLRSSIEQNKAISQAVILSSISHK